MAWFVGVLCALVFLGLLFRFPVQTVGLVALAVGGVWYLIDSNARNTARRYQEARSLVTPDQVVLTDLGLGESYGLWQMTGSATNRSSHTITQIEIQVRIQNCPTETTCVTVGQSTASDYVTIPPSQMRAIDMLPSFPNLPALENWRWNYQVIAIAAR